MTWKLNSLNYSYQNQASKCHFHVNYCNYNLQKSPSIGMCLAVPRHLGSSVREICLQKVYGSELEEFEFESCSRQRKRFFFLPPNKLVAPFLYVTDLFPSLLSQPFHPFPISFQAYDPLLRKVWESWGHCVKKTKKTIQLWTKMVEEDGATLSDIGW